MGQIGLRTHHFLNEGFYNIFLNLINIWDSSKLNKAVEQGCFALVALIIM